jgi:SAM-dependent methyltransferase
MTMNQPIVQSPTVPAPIISPIHRLRVAVLETWALWVALEVGLFEHLERPTSVSISARELGFDLSALRPLLEALRVTGYLEEVSPDQYVLAPGQDAYLLRRSSLYIGPAFGFLRTGRWFEAYPELLRRGGGLELPEEVWSHVVRGSSAYVAPAVRAILAGVPHVRTEPLRILDVGCGQGDYAAALVAANPRVQVLAIDPTPRVARIASERLSGYEQIEVRCSQVSEVGGAFDVILLNHVIHVVGSGEAHGILESCTRLLAPGGVVLVQELLETDVNGGALFGLMMRLLFPAGEVLTRGAFDRLLASAGLDQETLMMGEDGSGLILVKATAKKKVNK